MKTYESPSAYCISLSPRISSLLETSMIDVGSFGQFDTREQEVYVDIWAYMYEDNAE